MNAQPKFTPGPWQVGEVRHAGVFQLVTAGDRGYVCEVRCGFKGADLDCENREANARLIAAAPDLLSELQALVTAVRYADPPKLFNGVECHEARVPLAFIEGAEAALAKATQETSL